MRLVAGMVVLSCMCPMVSCAYVVGHDHYKATDASVIDVADDTGNEPKDVASDAVEAGSVSDGHLCCQVAPSDGGCQDDPIWGCVAYCGNVPWLCKTDLDSSAGTACNECHVGQWCQSVSGIGTVVSCD